MKYSILSPLIKISAISCMILVFSCKSKQVGTTDTKSGGSLAETPTAETGTKKVETKTDELAVANAEQVQSENAPPELYRLVISFISRGPGINFEAKQKLDNYLQLNETLKLKNPEIELTRWGREGEVDYCMKLSAFSKADQEKIVKGILEQLKNQKDIFINENAPCLRKRKK